LDKQRAPTLYELYHGVDEPPWQWETLKAGKLTARLDGIDLRDLRIGGFEVVRRLYAAVRDPVWHTIPGEYTILERKQSDDGFVIRFSASYDDPRAPFVWNGTIEGSSEGVLSYELDGEALADFDYCRIGFCVLHPDDATSGKRYRGRSADGEFSGTFPERIAVQRFENGVYTALSAPIDRLDVHMSPELDVRFEFEGDWFETEDQRNWTDASFKTYCTPLALGFPHHAVKGQRFRQRVTVRELLQRAEAPAVLAHAADREETTLTVGKPLGHSMPAVGFKLPEADLAHTSEELKRLRMLAPDHLRIDVHLCDPGFEPALIRAIALGKALDSPLEIALYVREQSVEALDRVAALLRGAARVCRFLVFEAYAPTASDAESTPSRWAEMARRTFPYDIFGADIVCGTDMNFCELNRTRPDPALSDAVCYSISPQVHAFDDASLIETLSAQAETVRSARAIFAQKPIVVSAVTFKPPFNPEAREAGPLASNQEALAEITDPRQMSLFGAGWTLGSLQALATTGAQAVTYYETVGPLGLMARKPDSFGVKGFPAKPGMLYPVYHLFHAVKEWRKGKLLDCESDAPLRAGVIACRLDRTLEILAANYSGYEQVVILAVEEAAGSTAEIGALAAEGWAHWRSNPEEGFAFAEIGSFSKTGVLRMQLKPYALVKVKAHLSV